MNYRPTTELHFVKRKSSDQKIDFEFLEEIFIMRSHKLNKIIFMMMPVYLFAWLYSVSV